MYRLSYLISDRHLRSLRPRLVESYSQPEAFVFSIVPPLQFAPSPHEFPSNTRGLTFATCQSMVNYATAFPNIIGEEDMYPFIRVAFLQHAWMVEQAHRMAPSTVYYRVAGVENPNNFDEYDAVVKRSFRTSMPWPASIVDHVGLVSSEPGASSVPTYVMSYMCAPFTPNARPRSDARNV